MKISFFEISRYHPTELSQASHWTRQWRPDRKPGIPSNVTELCKQFGLHPKQIKDWKRHLLENAANAFGGGTARDEPVDLVPLHAKLGQLTLENDFLESALNKGDC